MAGVKRWAALPEDDPRYGVPCAWPHCYRPSTHVSLEGVPSVICDGHLAPKRPPRKDKGVKRGPRAGYEKRERS